MKAIKRSDAMFCKPYSIVMDSAFSGRTILARSSLYPMAEIGGNEPAKESKEPSDAKHSNSRRRNPCWPTRPVSTCATAHEGTKPSEERDSRRFGLWSRCSHSRGFDSCHRSQGSGVRKAPRRRSFGFRGCPGGLFDRRQNSHRISKQGFSGTSTEQTSPVSPVVELREERNGLGKFPRRYFEPSSKREIWRSEERQHCSG